MEKVFNIINEQTRAQVFNPVARVLKHGKILGLANHTIIISRQGQERAIEDSAAPIKDAEGCVLGVVMVFHDVTARRRAETALLEAGELRRLALESADLGAWDYKFASGQVFWDERCQNMFGLSPTGQTRYDEAIARIKPEDRALTEQAVKNALDGVNGGAYHCDFRVIWPDGSLHWVTSHGRVYFEGEGKNRRAVRFIGVNREVTESKRAEEALRQSEERLRQLANGIPNLAWMAHADGSIYWVQ